MRCQDVVGANFEVEAAGASTLVHLPLAFVRSGSVYTHHGTVDYTISHGYAWSHTASTATTFYYLVSNITGVNSSAGVIPWYGFPLRCL